MMTVWKFSIPLSDVSRVRIPRLATILHVGIQNEHESPPSIQIWALVDPTESTEVVKFRVAGTGHNIEEANIRHVGTVIWRGLVFHVFKFTN